MFAADSVRVSGGSITQINTVAGEVGSPFL